METPIDEAMRRGDRKSSPDPTLRLKSSRAFDIPIDHNPDAVMGAGPSAETARHAMAAIWQTWHLTRQAAEDDSTDLRALARVATQAVERGLASADRALGTIDGQIRELERRIDAAVRPPQSDPFAGEIRHHWRTELTGRARADNLGRLMEAARADARTASAVLSAPAYLSGLDDEQHALVRRSAVAAHCPEQQADLDEAVRARAKVQSAVERVTQTLAPKIQIWTNPEPTALRELQRIAGGQADG